MSWFIFYGLVFLIFCGLLRQRRRVNIGFTELKSRMQQAEELLMEICFFLEESMGEKETEAIGETPSSSKVEVKNEDAHRVDPQSLIESASAPTPTPMSSSSPVETREDSAARSRPESASAPGPAPKSAPAPTPTPMSSSSPVETREDSAVKSRPESASPPKPALKAAPAPTPKPAPAPTPKPAPSDKEERSIKGSTPIAINQSSQTKPQFEEEKKASRPKDGSSTQMRKGQAPPLELYFRKQERNQRIVSLFQQGMPVKEIAMKTGMGQGEVQLIIDLYYK